MQNPCASLIISFYNKIDQLKLVFAGLEKQSFSNFEIIIADDGSSGRIINELEQLSNKTDLNTKHIWHKDQGWRKTEILNKAILASSSDYLIFIDGDCIPHTHFIKEHLENKNRGVVLAGRRVNLSHSITEKLTCDQIKRGYLEGWGLFLSTCLGLLSKGRDAEKGIYIRNPFLRKMINKKSNRGILGSNFSIHKDDILAINGFDERYKAPGIGEDSDLAFRLEMYGVRIQTIKNIAIQYHLYHKRLYKPGVNVHIFDETKKARIHYTPFGINKLIY